MLIKQFPLGQIETNCYIVTDENTLECAVIDPGDESNVVLDYLESNKLVCRYIFLTHGHFDHTMAVQAVYEETDAVVCINEKDINLDVGSIPYRFTPPKGSIFYKEGDEFVVGSLVFHVLETPGHTPGSVTLMCQDALFTGDTLFRDSCGRTDFPGGSMEEEMRSLKRLYELPGDYEVYPGHMDASTLERERKFNFYMRSAIGE